MGKFLVTGLTTLTFEVFIIYLGSFSETTQASFGLIFVVSMASFAIATIFMSLFEVSVDTLLQCYLIDELTHSKPQFADPEMTKILRYGAEVAPK